MVSIIIPIYNIEDYLIKCLDSVINQTYKDLEILLVDDGSTDSSGKICDEYAKKDGRITVLHKKNGGLSDARNYGINASHGDYLAFIDGDDYIHPQFIEILYDVIVCKNADLVSCDFVRSDKDGLQQEKTYTQKDIKKSFAVFTGEEAFKACWPVSVVAWNKLYRRELFNDLCYPAGKIHEDEYLFHRLLYKCSKVVHIALSLYCYVIRQGSITNVFNKQRLLCAKEAFSDRLSFCKEKSWGDTAKYALDAIGGYVSSMYFQLQKVYNMPDEAEKLLAWLRNTVADNSDIEINSDYKLLCESPELYEEKMKKGQKQNLFGKIDSMLKRMVLD